MNEPWMTFWTVIGMAWIIFALLWVGIGVLVFAYCALSVAWEWFNKP